MQMIDSLLFDPFAVKELRLFLLKSNISRFRRAVNSVQKQKTKKEEFDKDSNLHWCKKYIMMYEF